MTTRPHITWDEAEAKQAEHLIQMELWTSGARSYTNGPYTPEQVAIMDAQEVVKYAAAVSGYAAVIRQYRDEAARP